MFVSASFELATVETLVFSLNAIYMNQKAKTSNCSAEDRDGMDCPCRHPIFKTSRKTWTPKWIQIVSKNQLTWTQCGPNKQRCFRLRFDLYPQNASEWPPKGRGFSPKKRHPSFLSRRSPHSVVHIQDSPFSILDSQKNGGKNVSQFGVILKQLWSHLSRFSTLSTLSERETFFVKVLVASRIQTVGPQPSLTSRTSRMSMSQSSKMDRDDDGTANCPGAWTTWLWNHFIASSDCLGSQDWWI